MQTGTDPDALQQHKENTSRSYPLLVMWKNLPKEWITEATGSSAPIYYIVRDRPWGPIWVFLSCCKLISHLSLDILEETHTQSVSVLVPCLFRQTQIQVDCTAAGKLQARDGADSYLALMACWEWGNFWKNNAQRNPTLKNWTLGTAVKRLLLQNLVFY